jgi:hypothetical protein
MRLSSEYPTLRIECIDIADQPGILDHYGLLSFEYPVLATHAVAIMEDSPA